MSIMKCAAVTVKLIANSDTISVTPSSISAFEGLIEAAVEAEILA